MSISIWLLLGSLTAATAFAQGFAARPAWHQWNHYPAMSDPALDSGLQGNGTGSRNNYSARSAPADAGFAYADMTRANGEAAVNFATARGRIAEAIRMELENSVEEVRAYWTRRAIGQEQLLKLKYDPIKSSRRANSKHWQLLQDHPGASRANVVSGEELNWLLRRLSRNVLAYSYSQNYLQGADAQHPDLELSPEVLHGLRLKQGRVGTHQLVFRADDGTALQLDRWPWVLESSEYDSYRRAIEEARQRLQREPAHEKLTREALTEMEQSIVVLKRKLRSAWPLKPPYEEWSSYRDAADYLDSLYGEARAMQDLRTPVGQTGRLRFNPQQEGTSLISLLQFMRRNGLAFAPATPTDEPAYQQVFFMMRDLYANVAVDDENIQDDPNYLRLTPPATEKASGGR